MRALFIVIGCLFFLVVSSPGQVKLQENFETSDSIHLPLGWTSWNEAGFLPNDSLALWTVQDTGAVISGIADPRRMVAHSPTKATRASWVAGVDANAANHVADDWLITRRIDNIATDDSLRFWAIGGNGGTGGTYYADTLEVWIGDQDSLPASQILRLGPDYLAQRNLRLRGIPEVHLFVTRCCGTQYLRGIQVSHGCLPSVASWSSLMTFR